MMTFEEYLTGKKIDSLAFRIQEGNRWEEYKIIFEQMHPESFTTQKKFVINDLRRQYHLKDVHVQADQAGEKRLGAKPVLRPAASIPAEVTAVGVQVESESKATGNQTEEPTGRKPAKPVMRPVVKKTEEEISQTDNVESTALGKEDTRDLAETPQKPARPVIKPVMKKVTTESSLDESNKENSIANTTELAEDNTLSELPVTEATPKKPVRPVIKPVIQKSASNAPVEDDNQNNSVEEKKEMPVLDKDDTSFPEDNSPKKPVRPVIKPLIKKKEN